MLDPIPSYDELYVVSDIHMGGAPGFQILGQGPRLGRLILHVAAVRPDADVALVLNGDIIDTLAEDIRGYIAMSDARRVLERISRDPAFTPVWDGLATFVRTPRRHLVLVLGNHDIELALPHVENWVKARLAGGDAAALGRITFATRGAGHACRVGGARILCTHGNEVDDWNVVDFEALADLGAALSAERPYAPSDWRPNAGTQLVIDVMNDIKKDYPFVDLLKPETKAVVPILLALDPGRIKAALRAVPRLAGRYVWGALERRGYLSVDALEEGVDAGAGDAVLEELLGPRLREQLAIDGVCDDDADALLLAVERDVAAGRRPADVVAPGAGAETLGTFGYIVDRLRGVDRVEALRRALSDWLQDDTTFALDTRDSTYERITREVGGDVSFVVAGHTHLERALSFADGKRFYYNCGTWVRLLQLTGAALEQPDQFARVFSLLESGSIADLDQAEVPAQGGGSRQLILNRSSVVRIGADPGAVVGDLFHVEDRAGGQVDLRPVRGSRFAWR